MFKQSVTATILFICLTTVAPGIANAQGHDRIEGKLKPCRFLSPYSNIFSFWDRIFGAINILLLRSKDLECKAGYINNHLARNQSWCAIDCLCDVAYTTDRERSAKPNNNGITG